MKNNPLVLYILMRSDLASLTCGRSAAMSSHATSQLYFEWNPYYHGGKNFKLNIPRHGEIASDAYIANMFKEWEDETGSGFGTCIVLSVNESQMRTAVAKALDNNIVAGICCDPDYRIKDGAVYHSISLDTCGYIFGPKDYIQPITQDLKLYNGPEYA